MCVERERIRRKKEREERKRANRKALKGKQQIFRAPYNDRVARRPLACCFHRRVKQTNNGVAKKTSETRAEMRVQVEAGRT